MGPIRRVTSLGDPTVTQTGFCSIKKYWSRKKWDFQKIKKKSNFFEISKILILQKNLKILTFPPKSQNVDILWKSDEKNPNFFFDPKKTSFFSSPKIFGARKQCLGVSESVLGCTRDTPECPSRLYGTFDLLPPCSLYRNPWRWEPLLQGCGGLRTSRGVVWVIPVL